MEKQKFYVILLNLGGPRTQDEIRPFLRNLFRDPYILKIPGGKVLRPIIAELIVRLREKKSKGYYNLIGGSSPLYDIMLSQASALKTALKDEYDANVLIGMRYCSPSTAEALRSVPDGAKMVVIPMYPHFSETTTASSIFDLYNAIRQSGKKIEIDIIPDFYLNEDYISCCVEMINNAFDQSGDIDPNKTVLMFSAHSAPQSIVAAGDPYYWQTRASVSEIMKTISIKIRHYLSFQSKVGPTKWLLPATDALIERLALEGIENLIVFPISFTADNLETDYEMDILFKNIAHKAGIRSFKRISSLNVHPLFIECLKNLTIESWNRLSKPKFL